MELGPLCRFPPLEFPPTLSGPQRRLFWILRPDGYGSYYYCQANSWVKKNPWERKNRNLIYFYVFLKSLDLCSCLNSHTYFFNVFYAYVTYLIVTGSVLLEIHSSFLFNFNRYLIFQCMENLVFFCSYIAHLPLENVLWLNCYLLLSCSGGLTTREYIFFITYVC